VEVVVVVVMVAVVVVVVAVVVAVVVVVGTDVVAYRTSNFVGVLNLSDFYSQIKFAALRASITKSIKITFPI